MSGGEQEFLIPVLGQQIRARFRAGTGVPLVLCNGIGASLEVVDPLVEHLNPDTTVMRFDVPGAGASPDSPLPYGFPYLAAVLRRLLCKLGLQRTVRTDTSIVKRLFERQLMAGSRVG